MVATAPVNDLRMISAHSHGQNRLNHVSSPFHAGLSAWRATPGAARTAPRFVRIRWQQRQWMEWISSGLARLAKDQIRNLYCSYSTINFTQPAIPGGSTYTRNAPRLHLSQKQKTHAPIGDRRLLGVRAGLTHHTTAISFSLLKASYRH